MRRPDAAGRKHIVVARAQNPDRGNDFGLAVADDPRLAHGNAKLRQPARDIAGIGILRAPGQDFVADDENRGAAHAV